MSCCKWCCPCLTRTKKSKYHYVKFLSSKSPNAVPSREEAPAAEPCGIVPDKVFEFPQEKSEFTVHPQMFVEASSVISDQPKPKYHHGVSTIPQSSVGENESLLSLIPKKKHHSLRRFSQPMASTYRHQTSYKSKTLPKRRPSDGLSAPDKPLSLWMQASKMSEDSLSSLHSLPMLEESSLIQGDVLPVLQFSLLYDVQGSTLRVHLHYAANLPAKDRRGTSDPFIVLYMMPNKDEIFESTVVSQTLDPVFDESFEFHNIQADDIRQQTLVLRVYDHDRFSRNDFIGGIAFPLDSADLFGLIVKMEINENIGLPHEDNRGDLLMALSYNHALSLIKGIILKATNLKKQDIIGLADPYVKVYLYQGKAQIGVWKSSIKRNTLVPVYNESFQFDISGNGDTESIVMKIVVKDYDRFSKNDVIGTAMLGSYVSEESGRKHWKEMIMNPNSSVSQWHSLL